MNQSFGGRMVSSDSRSRVATKSDLSNHRAVHFDKLRANGFHGSLLVCADLRKWVLGS